MTRKPSTVIQSLNLSTKFDFEQQVLVNTTSTTPPTEPPLYEKHEYFTPTATAAPMVSSLQAQLRKDRWTKDPLGLGLFEHRAKGKPSNIIQHYITSPGDISLLPWDEALQIIDKFGLTTAKLHLIFAAHTMRQETPWKTLFTLKGSDLISAIGWDKTHKLPTYEKLKHIAMAAFALDCLTIQATWVEGKHKKGGILASVETSRMWNVGVKLVGQQNLDGKIEQPSECYITVQPGLWTNSFLNRAGAEAKTALYQFGYLAQDLLKIDPYHDELALRLGLHLTIESRFHVSGVYKVETLLENLLPKTIIDEARLNRDKARKLTHRWNHALEVLLSLKNPFQIEFDPTTYPKELRPGYKTRKPRGYFEQLLAAKITILPPAPIPELIMTKAKPLLPPSQSFPKSQKVEKPTTFTNELTGLQIQKARKAKGWSQAKLAGLLGVSQRYISMFEREERIPNAKQISKVRKILDI
jgi:DNA-binding XRE family transcriptional regulator